MSVKQLKGQNFQVCLILEVHVGSIIQSQQRKMKPPKKRAFGIRLKLKFKVGLHLWSLQNVLVCFFFFSWTMSPHFKGAQMFPMVLENKESSRFYSFLWSFYDVCGQINSWDVDTVLSVASACTATHTSALGVTGSLFFFFFFFKRRKSIPVPAPFSCWD